MRTTLVAVTAAMLALTACSSEPEAPPAPSRADYCEAFASLTPGGLETSENVAILADPGSTAAERSNAMSAQLKQQAGTGRTHAYDCDLPSDAALFDGFVERQEATRAAEEAKKSP